MNTRQAYALAHPLDYADGPVELLDPQRRMQRAGSLLVMTILAVDR